MIFRSFSLLLLCSPLLMSASDAWVNPTPATPTSYVYAPGVLVSEMLMSRYCPHFIASTGETVTCTKGINVIRMPATSANLAEITLKQVNKRELRKKKKLLRAQRTKKQSFISFLLTPFRMIWETASYCANYLFGIRIQKAPTKQLESLHMYWADPTKVNLAQEKDLHLFKETYDKHCAALQHAGAHNVVLYGTSRGSATVFNFGALYNPKEVRAIICEGLFDSIDHVYQETPSRRVKAMIKLLPKITEFDHNGILPIKLIESMPKEIPILLITSYKDDVVPAACTINIYNQLRNAGHNKVHLLVLKNASHVGYPHCKESPLYQQVVHAFYKHYNLPHIAEYAQSGYDYFLTETQPPLFVVSAPKK
jgi:hypothetical protein